MLRFQYSLKLSFSSSVAGVCFTYSMDFRLQSIIIIIIIIITIIIIIIIIFSTTVVEIFLILRRNEREMIRNVYRSACTVP
jgi:hypothetical protein